MDRLPSYRDAFAKRRCLIPGDGFFEWKTIGKTKQPFAFSLQSAQPFAIAGLWENWKDRATEQWLRTCTMITTDANELVAEVHDRMSAIIHPTNYARWLGEEPEHGGALKALLRTFESNLMISWPVSRRLNKPGDLDDASLLDRAEVSEALE